MLDHVPARLRVIRICRPRYGYRACGTIHQTPAPERPIAKGLASPGLLAHVLIAKYCDHLPLYRQSQIFARQGVEIDRSTLANWVGGACWWLGRLRRLERKARTNVDNNARTASDGTARTTTGAATSTTTTRSASENWYPDHAMYNATKDQLKAMPQFKYTHSKNGPRASISGHSCWFGQFSGNRELKMSRKPVKEHKGSKSTQASDQLHTPAKHIEETARLASSVEPNKDIEKVRKAKD